MNIRNDDIFSIKHVLTLFVILALMAGCVSTLPEKNKIKDPEVFEQKNLEIAYGFLQEGLPLRAIGRLEAILKINRQSARAYGMLGVVYQSQGEYALAEKNFQRSLDLDFKASDVRNNYGVLLYDMGRLDDARKAFLKVSEDVYYERRSRAFESLGFVALKTGDVTGAQQNFQRALRLDRNLARVSLELARLSFDQGQYVEAEGFFKNYQRLVTQERPTARSLWMGIELSRVFEDRDALEGYVDELTRLYPGSEEYRKYQASSRNE